MKVCFETFGCRLNKAEALQMEADYLAKGWEVTTKHKEADLFIVRGCSVTSRAQRDSEKLVGHLERHYPLVPIRVCGCLKTKKIVSPKLIVSPDQNEVQPVPTRTARAFLKVQDGCNGACTFCIVPKFRGKSVSTPYTELLDRTRRFIEAGYREIVITGCNLALYASEGKRLPELTDALATTAAEAGARIRLGSLEPGACALETVHVMAAHENICRYLHTPVQSGSNHMLLAMRRPYLVKDIEELVDTASKAMPHLGLGCDIMTGFPGETQFDHTANEGLLRRLPFTNAHVFPYSSRPGTIAATISNKVPKILKSARAHALSDIIKVRRRNYTKSFVGTVVEVVIEKESDHSGWISEYLKCKVVSSRSQRRLLDVHRKELVRAHVFSSHNDVLKAILI